MERNYVYVLQGNYGYGWDDLVTYEYDGKIEAWVDLKYYEENEPEYPHRIIKRFEKDDE